MLPSVKLETSQGRCWHLFLGISHADKEPILGSAESIGNK